jgi:hypothetical protein
MKSANRVICSLMFLSVPGVCLADVGDLGGVAIFFATVLFFTVGWLLLTCLIFWLLRRLTSAKRAVLTLLFLVAPVLCVVGLGVFEALAGRPGSPSSGITDRPIVLASVTFPAGSRVDYQQLGGGFWRKRLVQVQTDKAVMLGSVEITGLLLEDGSADTVSVTLNRDQSIEGWPCSAAVRTRTELDLTAPRPHLQSCWLATTKALDTISWPAATVVTRAADGDWTLLWQQSSNPQSPFARVFGFQVEGMKATYSPTFELKQWSGDAYGVDVEIGDYSFSRQMFTELIWAPGGDIRVEGKGRNVKTGEAVDCVLVQLQGRKFQQCKREDG